MSKKEYPRHLLRLKEEQEKAIKETDDKITQWKSFRSDYEALNARLKTLPDKLTHDVMVPFTKMAFMPGQLVHTNEVLVLLGDNWFVDRSAKQAAEIVERRISNIDRQLEDLAEQKRLLEPRRDFTAELHGMANEEGEICDIREDYDEEKEKQWKERHKQRVREHKQKKTESVKPMTEEELWERLDQLEKIENERKELQKVGVEGMDRAGAIPPMRNESQLLTGSDEENSSDSGGDLDSDDDYEETDEEELGSKGTVIHFSHSTLQTQGKDDSQEGVEKAIKSPADIYKQFYAGNKPTSILKKTQSQPKKTRAKKSRKPVVSFDTGSEDDSKQLPVISPPRQTVAAAFTGTVVEKPVIKPGLSAPVDVSVPQRPVSRFKSRTASHNLNSDRQQIPQGTVDQSVVDEVTKPVSRFKSRRQAGGDT